MRRIIASTIIFCLGAWGIFLWCSLAYLNALDKQATFSSANILLVLSYSSFIWFFIAIITVFLVKVCVQFFKLRPHLTLIFANLLLTSMSVAILVDCITYFVLDIHLYAVLFTENIGLFLLLREAGVTGYEIFVVGIVAALTSASHFFIYRQVKKKLTEKRFSRRQTGFAWVVGISLCLGFNAIAHHLAKKPERINPELVDFLPLYKNLHLPVATQAPFALQFPKIAPPHFQKLPHIIFLVAESLRSDAINDDLTPNIESLINQDQCIESPHHYANAHATQYGLFALFYGLYPHFFDLFREQKLPSQPLQFLKDNGYRLTGGSSSEVLEYSKGDFMMRIFDDFKQFIAHKDWRDDDAMLDWFEKSQIDKFTQPTFLWLFFNSTHHGYFYPPNMERFRPVDFVNLEYLRRQDNNQELHEKVKNRYRNAVGYWDALVARFLKSFKAKQDLRNTILVITGDHGEEFWDQGKFGHAATRFVDSRIHVPLIICADGLKQDVLAEGSVSSHVDVLPTVFSLLNPESPLDNSQFTHGRPFQHQKDAEPFTLVMGSGFPFRNNQLAIITQKEKIWLKKLGKKLTAFEVHAVLDASNNVVKGVKNADILRHWQPTLQRELTRFTDIDKSN